MSTPAAARRRLTVEDFNRLPPAPEGVRRELLGGELVVVEGAPTTAHQLVCKALYGILDRHVSGSSKGLVFFGPLGVVLGDDVITIPDVLVILAENRGILRPDGVYGPPDLIVEVTSPGTRKHDVATKRELYAAHGVRELWIAEPEGRWLLQLALDGAHYRQLGLHSGDAVFRAVVLPDLEVSLEGVWPEADAQRRPRSP